MGKRSDNRAERTALALLAARTIIAEAGVDALSMRRLATVSGFAVNTLYALFESRDGVLAAVIADGIGRVAFKLDELGAEDPIEGADQLIALSVQRIEEEADFSRPLYRALSALGPTHPIFATGQARAASTLQRLLERAQRTGQIERDVDTAQLSRHIVDGFMRASVRWAHDAYGFDTLAAEARYGLYLALSAVAADAARDALRARFRTAQKRRLST